MSTSGFVSAGASRGASDAAPAREASPSSPGQVFVDLLLLGALASQAPVALLSVRQPDGRWTTLTHGLDSRQGVNDGQLYEALAAESEAVEIRDLVTALPNSPMVQAPHSMRWAYGVALRDEAGTVVGVVAVLDKWLRQLTKREQRAVAAMARQLAAPLVGVRRSAGPLPEPGRDADGARNVAEEVTNRSSTGAAEAPLGDSGGHSAPLVSVSPSASVLEGGRMAGRDRGRRAPVTSGGAGALGSDRHPLLRSQEVAELFDVTERTVINWAAAGKLPSLRTIGGHLRFRRDDVMRLLWGSVEQA